MPASGAWKLPAGVFARPGRAGCGLQLDDADSLVALDRTSEPQLVLPMPDVAELRRRLKLSQAEFATRFGFGVATMRNWEQGRTLADGPARVPLAVIANESQAVNRALRPVERPGRSSGPKRKAA